MNLIAQIGAKTLYTGIAPDPIKHYGKPGGIIFTETPINIIFQSISRKLIIFSEFCQRSIAQILFGWLNLLIKYKIKLNLKKNDNNECRSSGHII